MTRSCRDYMQAVIDYADTPDHDPVGNYEDFADWFNAITSKESYNWRGTFRNKIYECKEELQHLFESMKQHEYGAHHREVKEQSRRSKISKSMKTWWTSPAGDKERRRRHRHRKK